MRVHVQPTDLQEIALRNSEAYPLGGTPLEVQYATDISLLLQEIHALKEDMKDMEHYLSVISER